MQPVEKPAGKTDRNIDTQKNRVLDSSQITSGNSENLASKEMDGAFFLFCILAYLHTCVFGFDRLRFLSSFVFGRHIFYVKIFPSDKPLVISSVVEGAEITTKSHGLSFKLNYHLRSRDFILAYRF